MKRKSTASTGSSTTEDVENSLQQMEIEQPQDEGVRRQIRQDYRVIQSETARNRAGLVSGSAEKLRSALDDCDKIFQNVQHCREAAIDAQLLSNFAQMGKEKVQSFASGLSRLNSIQFVEKLITRIGGNVNQLEGENCRISKEGWLELGKGCTQYFKHSPSLHFMFGAFSRDPPETKQKRERKVFPKDKDSQKSAPKQVNSLQEMEKKESTTIEVERIYKILRQLYNQEQTPICYFEFVTNPDSFAQTVENMFHVSFLVRDGWCRIELDSERLPTIVPLEKNRDQPTELQNQIILSMTQEEWKNVVETFEIKTPLIPSRKQRRQHEGNTQPSCSQSDKSKSQSSSTKKLKGVEEMRPSTSQSNKSTKGRRPATPDIESDSD